MMFSNNQCRSTVFASRFPQIIKVSNDCSDRYKIVPKIFSESKSSKFIDHNNRDDDGLETKSPTLFFSIKNCLRLNESSITLYPNMFVAKNDLKIANLLWSLSPSSSLAIIIMVSKFSLLIPITLFICAGTLPAVKCDIFSSSASIQSLMHLERHLVTSLSAYLENLEEKTNQIKLYLKEFACSAGQRRYAGTYADNIMDNPLQAFQLVKRLTINWNKIIEFDRDQDQLLRLRSHYQSIWPDRGDLNGVALALIRLQDTYNLSMSDLANGLVDDQHSFIQMTARDCLYLGKNAFNNGYYGHSLEWFDEALRRAHHEGNQTASVDEIVPFYNLAIEYIDKLDNKLQEQNYPAREGGKLRVLEGDNDDFRRYQKLCRGENVSIETSLTTKRQQIIDRKCFYWTNNGHFWLRLKPIKVEQYNSNPFIALFHEMIHEKEIETIKELSKPILTRAKVLTDEKDNEISTVRVSQTAWFSENSHPMIMKINQRIEAVTGLSVNIDKSDCELVQIANYGVGGHYLPHYDYLIKDKPESERINVSEKERYAGDRIATFMLYLSDVIKGGSTVFTRLNVRVDPQKGSAIFWYNLFRNGEGILDTVHGACPVLLGEKWVANYWIREHGQMFKRKCSLYPNE
ncbi:complexin [Sarcoptes scabiei]|nr:complexin [Sarcoptes scabiei]